MSCCLTFLPVLPPLTNSACFTDIFFFLKLGTKTANRAEQIIPILKERAASLRTTFLTIDKLKELIEKIKLNVLEAEKLVNEAEEANSTISMTKLFSVFSSKKDKPKTDRPSGSLKVIDTRSEFDAMRKEVNAAISK